MQDRKIALVTGAGSGIGRAVAIGLLRAGYSVALAGRRMAPLQESVALAAAEDKSVAERALAISADVSDPASARQLFEQAQARFGRLDLLFNNAGVFTPGTPLEELDFAQWQASVSVNLTGAFLCTQQAFKLMKAQQPRGGRIINNGSISAHAPRPNSVAYTATKHAITGLTKSSSLDGRQYDIACGQIDIGNASTDMTEKMKKGVPQADGSVRIEPTMSVDHVANAVLYMDSLPLDANVQFMTVMATKMPFVGRG
ncbi:MAG TPA: SDR family oxidoreductase [Herbaspirillum sp.]|jgi:NAD(P)-dependent dehydrogenase (short-subunit alcohol dehydrogenase family)